jgi:hypothetical protein
MRFARRSEEHVTRLHVIAEGADHQRRSVGARHREQGESSHHQGGSAFAASDLKRARQRLEQTMRDMIDYAHHLQTLRARKKLPGTLRTDLLAAGTPLTDAAKSLERTVQCPADAPR